MNRKHRKAKQETLQGNWLDEETVNANYKSVFDSPPGQMILEDLIRVCELPTVDANNINPNTTIWKEARRNLVAYIFNKLGERK